MSEKNTILERIEPDVPKAVDNQQTTVYIPIASTENLGAVKPDGKQFSVDADGTLHVNEEYVTRIQNITDKKVTSSGTITNELNRDENGNTIVTVILSNGESKEFTVSKGDKGDKGLPYIVKNTVINYTEQNTVVIFKSDLSREPELSDIIFAIMKSENMSWVVLLQVDAINNLQVSCSFKTIVETTGVQGETGLDALTLDVFLTLHAPIKSNTYFALNPAVFNRPPKANEHLNVYGRLGNNTYMASAGIGAIQPSYVPVHINGDWLRLTGNSIEAIEFNSEVTDGYKYMVTFTNGDTTYFVAPFGPEGPQGKPGEPFSIAKVYESIAEMNADFNTTSVKEGQFVIIDTGDINDPDNAKLYTKGSTSWKYITDLSGAIGMQGPPGKDGNTLSVQLGMTGIIEANRIVFTVEDAESYIDKRVNLQKFMLTAYLPIAGVLDDTLPVNITFGDTTYALYNCLTGSNNVITVGNLMGVASYSQEGGYFFNFEAIFMQNSSFHGFVIVPPAITAKQLNAIIQDNDTIITDLSEDGTKLIIYLKADIVSKLQRVLVKPVSSTNVTLVGIDSANAQKNYKMGNGLMVENGDTLSAYGDIIPITHNELLIERAAGTLKKGTWYRITDYQCTTSQLDTQSANHQFDILVLATDTNMLSEIARACLHDGDTYFENARIEAWEIKYSVDNDITRFSWADTATGKGVIYYLKDEFDNECPYDFKNMQFKRYKSYDNTSNGQMEEVIAYNPYLGYLDHSSGISIDEDDFVWAYTFCYADVDADNVIIGSTIADGTIVVYDKSKVDVAGGGYAVTGGIQNNKIASEFVLVNVDDDTGKENIVRGLNNIVIYCCPNTDVTDGEGGMLAVKDNSFYPDCHDMTFLGKFLNNTFKNQCFNFIGGVILLSNTFGNGCYYNTFGNGCYSNTFGNDCHYNTFGNNCYSNTFGNDCYYNTFGNGCYYNTFGNDCRYNTFGNGYRYNTFGNGCYYNTFGNDCYYNTFGNGCYYNTFGNVNTLIDRVRYIVIEPNVRYIDLTTTDTRATYYLQNVQIQQGIQGLSNARKTITIPNRNNANLTLVSSATTVTITV